MIVEINPQKNYRTTNPIYINVKDVDDVPEVSVEKLGDIPVTKKGDFYQAHFWAQQEGHYGITVLSGKDKFEKEIVINEQVFIPFHYEFTAFFIVLMLSLFGVYLWMKKRKKNQNE